MAEEGDRSGSDVSHMWEQKSLFRKESGNTNPNPGKKMAMEGRLDRVIEIDLSVKPEEEPGVGDEDSPLDFKQKIISPSVYNLEQSEDEEGEAAQTSKENRDNYYCDQLSLRVPTPITSRIDGQTKVFISRLFTLPNCSY